MSSLYIAKVYSTSSTNLVQHQITALSFHALTSLAGKGRSGTLACSYLLTLEEVPTGPQLERSHTRKEWANKRAAEMMAAVTSISESDAANEQLEEESTASPPPGAQPIVGTTLSPKADGVIAQSRDEKVNMIGPGDNVKIEQGAMSPTHSQPHATTPNDGQTTEIPVSSSPVSRAPTNLGYGLEMTNAQATNSTSSLDNVLALHSARRMKAPSENGSRKTPRRGVSIPSQRRFLFYWSQILSGAAPNGFWEIPRDPKNAKVPQQQVRIHSFTIRTLDPGTAKQAALKVISKVLDKTTGDKVYTTVSLHSREIFADADQKVRGKSASGDIWVSLARYDDEFVNTLEGWEKHTRDPDPRNPRKMGRRRPGSEAMPNPVAADGEQGIAKLFDDGKWDSGKMVRSFARMAVINKEDVYATHEDVRREDEEAAHSSLTDMFWAGYQGRNARPPPSGNVLMD
jgi:phosphatidylinositol-3,4,5-trisphosphate 3-phosphatase/dual-specificity protein phosphatase PTEN